MIYNVEETNLDLKRLGAEVQKMSLLLRTEIS